MDKNEVILGEVRHSYDNEFSLKNNYESKANYNIAINGIIISILLGSLAVFIRDYHISIISFWTTIVSIIFISCSLYLSFRVIRITNYQYMPTDYNVIDEWKNENDNKLVNTIIDTYVANTRSNAIMNLDKLKVILDAQKSMLISIISIAVSIITLVIGYIY